MVRHQGGGNQATIRDLTSADENPQGYAKATYAAICAACHSLDGARLAGPSLKGLFGKEQEVIRKGKTVTVTIDDDYLFRAINDPLAEVPVGYPPAMPALNLQPSEQKALVEWIKSQR